VCSGAETQITLYLTELIDAWPALPNAIKAGIIAMVRAATDEAQRDHSGPPQP